METEWIDDDSSIQIKNLLKSYPIEYIVGSVHHVLRVNLFVGSWFPYRL